MITAADLAPALNAPGRFFLIGGEPEGLFRAARAAAKGYGIPFFHTSPVLPLPPAENAEDVATWEFRVGTRPFVQVDVVYAHVNLYGASTGRATLVAAGIARGPTSSTERLPMNVLERLSLAANIYKPRPGRPAGVLDEFLFRHVWDELKPATPTWNAGRPFDQVRTLPELPVIADWLEERDHPTAHCRLSLALQERIRNSAWNPR